jgi:predicted membrane channel-forming protein YqfA (hemolysin III family)
VLQYGFSRIHRQDSINIHARSLAGSIVVLYICLKVSWLRKVSAGAYLSFVNRLCRLGCSMCSVQYHLGSYDLSYARSQHVARSSSALVELLIGLSYSTGPRHTDSMKALRVGWCIWRYPVCILRLFMQCPILHVDSSRI